MLMIKQLFIFVPTFIQYFRSLSNSCQLGYMAIACFSIMQKKQNLSPVKQFQFLLTIYNFKIGSTPYLLFMS